MNQAEINSKLDLAYAKLNGSQSIVKKEHKSLIVEGLNKLHEALKKSQGVTPELPSETSMREGSTTQIAVTNNNIKTAIINIDDCIEAIEDEALAEMLTDAANIFEQYIADSEVTEEINDQELGPEPEIIEQEDEDKKKVDSEPELSHGLNDDEHSPAI